MVAVAPTNLPYGPPGVGAPCGVPPGRARRRGLCVLAWLLACEPAPLPERLAVPEPTQPLRPEGERGSVPPEARVTDYVIDARLDADTHTVTGTARITWHNRTAAPASDLALHLYMNAFRAEDTAWMKESRGTHRSATQHKKEGRWGYIDVTAARLLGQGPVATLQALEGSGAASTALTWAEGADPSLASVALPRPVAPGEAITVELDFVTQLPRVFARTGYEGDFHMVGQWYPKLGVREPGGWRAHVFTLFSEFYADFGDYVVRLDVPEDMVVGATGVLAEERPPEAGRRRVTYKAEMVHDFAWAASPDFLEYRDDWRGIRIRQLIPRALAADADAHLEALVATLESMDRRFGPYPWSTITVIHPPSSAGGAQGMEYPTLFTTSDMLRVPLPLRLLGLHERISGEFTTVHEFGHQYFQGMLASDEFAQPWLDEGLNSYANVVTFDDWLGDGAAVAGIGNQKVTTVDFTRVALQFQTDLDPVDTPADGFREYTGSYGGTVYRKTSALLHTLRRLVGEQEFDRAFKVYCDRFRFRHPRGADLEDTLVQELGATVRLAAVGADGRPVDLDLRDFLQQGLRTTAAVDFQVARISNRRPGGSAGWHRGTDGHLALTEPPEDKPGEDGPREGFALVVRKGEFRLPVEVEAEFADGSRERTTWSGQERYHIFTWPERQLVSIALDPDEKLLLEGQRIDDRAVVGAARDGDGLSAPLGDFAEATHLALLGGLGL